MSRSDTNRSIQAQKTVRGLQFRILEVEGLWYLCSENKGANQLSCAHVFAYEKGNSQNADHNYFWEHQNRLAFLCPKKF